jgi:hypothetical protein
MAYMLKTDFDKIGLTRSAALINQALNDYRGVEQSGSSSGP